MEPNGIGMTQTDLEKLPEVFGVVLWQDDEGPTTVIDSQGRGWFIGMYKGKLCKCKSIS